VSGVGSPLATVLPGKRPRREVGLVPMSVNWEASASGCISAAVGITARVVTSSRGWMQLSRGRAPVESAATARIENLGTGGADQPLMICTGGAERL
jgi:hypothetical protein